MEAKDAKIILHPQAKDLLYNHFRALTRIFGDALGQLEMSYIAIALLTPQNELLFFSSHPRIELGLIENHKWVSDPRFQHDFFLKDNLLIWDEKLNACGGAIFTMGLSISAAFDGYRVVHSFALNSARSGVKERFLGNIHLLTGMGRYCLRRILSEIALPEWQPNASAQRTHLKLIINNEAPHEQTT